MNIGTAADRSGLPTKTIRYYEDIGLLKPDRAGNGYRDYSTADVHRLRFLQRARITGLGVDHYLRQLGAGVGLVVLPVFNDAIGEHRHAVARPERVDSLDQ